MSNSTDTSDLVLFKRAYRGFVKTQYPRLKATPQEGGDKEYFISALGLPSGIRFKHAFFRGEVSLIFERGWRETAKRFIGQSLPEGARVVQHDGELHIRMEVEKMDERLPFDPQSQIAAAALDKIEAMIDFALTVYSASK